MTRVGAQGAEPRGLSKFRLAVKQIFSPVSIRIDKFLLKINTMFYFMCPVNIWFFNQVNGVDLAEVEGGEVAITNTLSGVGRPFVLILEFTKAQEQSAPGPP